MKTTKSLVWVCLTVLALSFASTAFAAPYGSADPRHGNGKGGGDGLGWLRNTIRGIAAAISDMMPTPSMVHEPTHQ